MNRFIWLTAETTVGLFWIRKQIFMYHKKSNILLGYYTVYFDRQDQTFREAHYSTYKKAEKRSSEILVHVYQTSQYSVIFNTSQLEPKFPNETMRSSELSRNIFL